MGRVAAVGIDDDLAAGQTGVAFGTADDETAGGVDEVLGVLIQQLSGDDFAHNVLDQVIVDGLLVHIGAMLGGQNDGIDANGLAVHVFNGHLRLAVGTQVGQQAVLAHLGQLTGQAMRQRDGHGHQFLGLVAGIAEHHALVAGTGVVLSALAAGFQRIVNAHGDVGRLLIQHDLYSTGLGVKTAGAVLVADLGNGVADDLVVLNGSLGGDLTHHQHHAGGGNGLACNAGHGVLCKMCIQDSVGDGVADLIGMALGHGFGSKVALAQLDHVLRPFCSSSV